MKTAPTLSLNSIATKSITSNFSKDQRFSWKLMESILTKMKNPTSVEKNKQSSVNNCNKQAKKHIPNI